MTRGPKFTRATCTTPSCTRARPYTVSCYIYGKERGRSLSHLSSTGRQADNSRCGANATAAIDDVLLRFLELAHSSPSSTFPFSLSLCISFSSLSISQFFFPHSFHGSIYGNLKNLTLLPILSLSIIYIVIYCKYIIKNSFLIFYCYI